MSNHTRATIYFSKDVFIALRMKAAATNQTLSGIVNETVKTALAEDATDYDAFTLLRDESVDTFATFVSSLRARGTL
jgi:hypothetical protein